jgi:drug/metabolite transporter (DMT)-like permease
VIAVLGGLGAAAAWAIAILCSSRSTRMIGAASVLASVMVVGLTVTLPFVVVTGAPDLDTGTVALLLGAGISSVLGLSLIYTALRTGKVGIVAPIVATEGAIAAVLAVLAGETIAAGTAVTLAVLVLGVVLSAAEREPEDAVGGSGVVGRAAALAVGASVAFGAGIYLIGRVSDDVPIPWAILPARLLGVLVITVPVLLSSRLRLTRPAVPYIVVGGIAEVAGLASFALGARHGIAVSAVLASQFGALGAVAAYLLFGERLTRIQVAGAVTITIGVAVLSWLQA